MRDNVETNNKEMHRAIEEEKDNSTLRYTRPNVMYDAWCCVGGVTKPCFLAAELVKRYPSLKKRFIIKSGVT